MWVRRLGVGRKRMRANKYILIQGVMPRLLVSGRETSFSVDVEVSIMVWKNIYIYALVEDKDARGRRGKCLT